MSTPNLQLLHLAYHTQKDPRLGETLSQIQKVLNNIAGQTATAPEGLQSPPAAPTSITVTAADGIFDVAIADNDPTNTQLSPDYFIEYSTTQNFLAPTVIYLGPARNWRRSLGNQTLYFRCYSQYARASQPSPTIYFGTTAAPTPVVGGGASSGPTVQPSQGSGTAPTNGQSGGSGFGKKDVRRNPGIRELR